MTLSNRIRAAALGPRTHHHFVDLFDQDKEAWDTIYDHCKSPQGVWPHWIPDVERRMFLLFFAEFLENP